MSTALTNPHSFCEVYKPTISRFIEAGRLAGNSPAEVAKALSEGATVIVSSTVSPAYVNQLEQRLQALSEKLYIIKGGCGSGSVINKKEARGVVIM
ncbi:hypothetical protein RND81_03G027000 [Saponaria officinalis]|uniref:Uncharacterized protein n=1 Tax=Saponaria officinalis TaxID=3572 RepID=A0AAW1M351_SAPOF